MPICSTSTPDIAFEHGGSGGGPPLLLHGWPDDPRGSTGVTPLLERAGYRWIAPCLHGLGATRFRGAATPRAATGVALAQDAFDLAGALGSTRFAVIGHDRGGRAAYAMAAMRPGRLAAIAALAIGHAPCERFVTPDVEQSRRWWYKWYTTTGAAPVASAPTRSASPG